MQRFILLSEPSVHRDIGAWNNPELEAMMVLECLKGLFYEKMKTQPVKEGG